MTEGQQIKEYCSQSLRKVVQYQHPVSWVVYRPGRESKRRKTKPREMMSYKTDTPPVSDNLPTVSEVLKKRRWALGAVSAGLWLVISEMCCRVLRDSERQMPHAPPTVLGVTSLVYVSYSIIPCNDRTKCKHLLEYQWMYSLRIGSFALFYLFTCSCWTSVSSGVQHCSVQYCYRMTLHQLLALCAVHRHFN